jgi:hypothetical protein
MAEGRASRVWMGMEVATASAVEAILLASLMGFVIKPHARLVRIGTIIKIVIWMRCISLSFSLE